MAPGAASRLELALLARLLAGVEMGGAEVVAPAALPTEEALTLFCCGRPEPRKIDPLNRLNRLSGFPG